MPPKVSKPNQRRTIYQDFRRLYKFALGKVYKPLIRSGRDEAIGELRLNFGDVFAERGRFYVDPNRDKFVAWLIHDATGGRVPLDAEVAPVFVRETSEGGSVWYRIDEEALERVGCTKRELAARMSRLPIETGAPIEDGSPDLLPPDSEKSEETATNSPSRSIETTPTSVRDPVRPRDPVQPRESERAPVLSSGDGSSRRRKRKSPPSRNFGAAADTLESELEDVVSRVRACKTRLDGLFRDIESRASDLTDTAADNAEERDLESLRTSEARLKRLFSRVDRLIGCE